MATHQESTRHDAPLQEGVPLDVQSIRRDFPILERRIGKQPLVYLDNAATSQTPRAVIDRLCRYYETENANIHRGVHTLSQEATHEYEKARLRVQRFLHAAHVEEIIFTRGTTESINLVAQTFGRTHLAAGDEVLISTVEHHSNIVPWQLICEERGAKLRVVPMSDDGGFLFDEYEKLLGPRTRLVAVSQVSNALGTINPVRKIIERAHEHGVPVLVDGAQAVPHLGVDVGQLDCDFYCFSAHKVYGPTGVGVLYGRKALLESMPPWQGGGEMIRSVTFEKTEYNELPHKFEAGTPNIAGGIAFGAAIEYVESIGIDRIAAHEDDLLAYGTAALSAIPRVHLVGTTSEKTGVLSFIIDDIHPHDIGTILDQYGIAVRTGHHCAQPVMDRLGIPATARASLAMYNTREEIDAFIEGLEQVFKVFG